MNFTDGYWQMRPGFEPCYETQVHEVEIEPEAMIVQVSTRKLDTRGDTLGYPLITIRFSSPMENVVCVQISHHKGSISRQPEFVLHTAQIEPAIVNNEQISSLTSGQLSVHIHRGKDWLVEYKAGDRILTSSGWRA